MKNSHYYMLDLVEAGMETSGKLEKDYEICKQYSDYQPVPTCNWWNGFRQERNSVFGERVNSALHNVLRRLPDLEALEVLREALLFQWRFVDMPPVDIRDVNTPIDLRSYPMYQVAARRDHTITINRLIWDKMDLMNQTALITHELFYSFVRPTG